MKIAIDVDGVLLDFYRNAFQIIEGNSLKKNSVPKWDCPLISNNWHLIENNPIFWKDLTPIIQPHEIDFDFDMYLTAIPDQHLKLREKNLYSLGYPKKPVVVSNDKIHFCEKNGIDVLIDDKVKTVQDGQKSEKVTVIQFYPYFANWEKIGTHVAENAEELNFIVDKLTSDAIRR